MRTSALRVLQIMSRNEEGDKISASFTFLGMKASAYRRFVPHSQNPSDVRGISSCLKQHKHHATPRRRRLDWI